MIALERASPMPGSSLNCCSVAVLRSSFSAAAGAFGLPSASWLQLSASLSGSDRGSNKSQKHYDDCEQQFFHAIISFGLIIVCPIAVGAHASEITSKRSVHVGAQWL